MSSNLGSAAAITMTAWLAGFVALAWAVMLLDLNAWLLFVYGVLGLPVLLMVQMARHRLRSRGGRRAHHPLAN